MMGVTFAVFGDMQKRKRSLRFKMFVPVDRNSLKRLEREQTGAAKVSDLAKHVFQCIS